MSPNISTFPGKWHFREILLKKKFFSLSSKISTAFFLIENFTNIFENVNISKKRLFFLISLKIRHRKYEHFEERMFS